MVNADPSQQEAVEPTMSLFDHVRELRDRLFRIVVALIIGSIVGYYFRNELLEWLKQPYAGKLFAGGVPDQLTVSATIAITVGAIIALPVIVWQVLAFVAPGLYPHEKRWLFFAIPFGLVLFVVGSGFAYQFMLPTMIPFLTGILTTQAVENLLRLDDYVTFVTGVLFWMGVGFELPVVVLALVKVGLLEYGQMKTTRPYAIVVIFLLAAVITPTPDVFTLILMGAPMVLLYEACIWIARWMEKSSANPA